MVWQKRRMHAANTGIKTTFFRLAHMEHKQTLVLGASENPERYSNRAVQQLVAHAHPVIALGRKKGSIGTIAIETEKAPFANIDTVTLYLNPANQKEYYDYILSLHPKRIIFNPGTENDELSALARKNGIQIQEACTLVLLSIGGY
jgi:predicted CoA-binding protein